MPHQDADGPGRRPQPVLQCQVVMAMVRVLRPPEGDAVCRQNGGGAHRHQSETHLCCTLTLTWRCDQVLLLPASVLYTAFSPVSLFPRPGESCPLSHSVSYQQHFRVS